ncbi:acetyl-CoA acetyltransferase [Mycobacterium xenopi]|uniref:Thiolase N-terminal domain-containing protein n=1 Tax=Mycobacterium xenopi TaxID=1789 RepID=A0AAD1H0C0_MYCXE|nr:hypothetical protein MYXE_09230 [Mycobacterium xenopi]SPX78968.1 acetyl-CoA acetyltransferase [Mycobacterium xenopi]
MAQAVIVEAVRQQSVHFAAAGVVAGHYDVVVAGGVESMSRVPMGSSTAVGVTCFRSGLWTVAGISRTRG